MYISIEAQDKHIAVFTFGSFGQLPGEHDVSQLALSVGRERPISLRQHQVIKVDLTDEV